MTAPVEATPCAGGRGRWFITPHAVRRYIERCPGARQISYEEALERLISASETAHFVKARRNPGEELWRGGKPDRLRFVIARVHGGLPQLVTVLRGCDTPEKGQRWQREPKSEERTSLEREGTDQRTRPAIGPSRSQAERSLRPVDPKLAVAGSTLGPEDFIWAQTSVHRRRVDAAIAAVRRAVEIGPIGVAFSGGKDSTCVAHLVRSVAPDAPIAFFDSGDELPGTLEMVRHVGAETVTPRLTMREMARYAGWWGYVSPIDPDCSFDAKRILISEPAETFVVRRGLRVIAHGIRAEESHARSKHVGARGELYEGADRTWVCMPLARWRLADVWAYIASHGLRYHEAYDAMTDAGIPRESQRVSGLLGERGSGWGRHELLRLYAPESYRDIIRQFPGLAR